MLVQIRSEVAFENFRRLRTQLLQSMQKPAELKKLKLRLPSAVIEGDSNLEFEVEPAAKVDASFQFRNTDSYPWPSSTIFSLIQKNQEEVKFEDIKIGAAQSHIVSV